MIIMQKYFCSTLDSIKVKGKVDHATPERRWGAHLPLIAVEPVGG